MVCRRLACNLAGEPPAFHEPSAFHYFFQGCKIVEFGEPEYFWVGGLSRMG